MKRFIYQNMNVPFAVALLALLPIACASSRKSFETWSHATEAQNRRDFSRISNEQSFISRRRLLSESDDFFGLTALPGTGPTQASTNGTFFRHDSVSVVLAVDWRPTNASTPVKNQGQCASCWVLATADAISMMWQINSGYASLQANNSFAYSESSTWNTTWGNADVSAQQICDCGLGNCCQGGWPEWAFSYVLANGGVSSWQNYPYFQLDSGKCHTSLTSNSIAQITGWELVPAGSLEAAKKTLARQPFVALISAESHSFQTYQGGIYDDATCGDDLNHVVLVVGYGTSNGTEYLIVKNSWGSNWGEKGYMYLAISQGKPLCGILNSPGLYPVFYPTTVASSGLNPCTSYGINPCGAGQCWSELLSGLLEHPARRRVRCICPPGFVESTKSNPAKCVRDDPCLRSNQNPCGSGTCRNLGDGTYSCSCTGPYFIGSSSLGATTCVSGDSASGLPTIIAPPGTTIQAVASAYSLTTSTLLNLNPWLSSTSTIPPGTAVVVAPDNPISACVRSYVVQPLDTCISIVVHNLLTLSLTQLLSLNPLLDCLNLVVGSVLCLRINDLTGVVRPPKCGAVYQALSSDTCASIQNQFGLSPSLFTSLNPGITCSAPFGNPLSLCVSQSNGAGNCNMTYRVQHGDTCASVWLAYNLTQAQFFQLNPGVRCQSPYFQVGQVLCVDQSQLYTSSTFFIPHVISAEDSLAQISSLYTTQCGNLSSVPSICTANGFPSNCSTLPQTGTILKIPCRQPKGRTCGCDSTSDPYFGADGIWYTNYCHANCNYGLPASKTSDTCKSKCANRAGLTPANDPNFQCTRPCPWPQWNPQPANWWWFSDTFAQYYLGACQDWCVGSANTYCSVRNDWSNWSNVYADCVSDCRNGKV